MRERKKRRAAAGLPPLIAGPIPQPKGAPESEPWDKNYQSALAHVEMFENYWIGQGGSFGGLSWFLQRTHPGEGYEGDYSLSLRQFKADDAAEQAGTPFTLLKSPDGISPYSPTRLAQVALEDNFSALRSEETEATRLLAQTLTPEQVAQISSSQTVTDPVGRLLLGILEQNAAHTAGLNVGIKPTPAPVHSGAPPPTLTASAGTDAQRLGIVAPMADKPPAISQAGIVEDTGGGSPVLFWALAIGGLIFSLSTGKRKVNVF